MVSNFVLVVLSVTVCTAFALGAAGIFRRSSTLLLMAALVVATAAGFALSAIALS